VKRRAPAALGGETPWVQQPGESGAAFRAFSVYRDMGPCRTVVEAYRQTKGKPSARQAAGTWNAWAARWRWAERARTYDAHLDRVALAARAEAVARLQEKHKFQLRHLFNQAIRAGQQLDPDRMTPEQVLRFTEKVIILERLVHGQPVTIEQVRSAGLDGGVLRQVSGHVIVPPDPDPAYLAEVMRILSGAGAPDGAAAPAGKGARRA
jgi:hypothetical protein